MSNLLKLLISLVVPNAVGLLSLVITIPAIGTWYDSIEKPLWTPPNAVFGPIWTILYVLMGVAVYFVWKDGTTHRSTRKGLIWFDVQLALNFLWSVAFFGLKSPGLAFVIIIALWIAIVVTMSIFWEHKKKLSMLLLVPYILWVTFAVALNGQIWFMN